MSGKNGSPDSFDENLLFQNKLGNAAGMAERTTDLNFDPDFSRVGSVFANVWESAGKGHLDGVVGDVRVMQEINAEYDRMFLLLKAKQNTMANGDETGKTRHTTETPEEFRSVVEALLKLDGIEVELCGAWLWISGDHLLRSRGAEGVWLPLEPLEVPLVLASCRGRLLVEPWQDQRGRDTDQVRQRVARTPKGRRARETFSVM